MIQDARLAVLLYPVSCIVYLASKLISVQLIYVRFLAKGYGLTYLGSRALMVLVNIFITIIPIITPEALKRFKSI